MQRFISWRAAGERTGYHPISLKRLARQGKFPKGVRLAKNKSALVESEVEEWIAARIAERDAGTDAPGLMNAHSADAVPVTA